jgi:hypothetical protein
MTEVCSNEVLSLLSIKCGKASSDVDFGDASAGSSKVITQHTDSLAKGKNPAHG